LQQSTVEKFFFDKGHMVVAMAPKEAEVLRLSVDNYSKQYRLRAGEIWRDALRSLKTLTVEQKRDRVTELTKLTAEFQEPSLLHTAAQLQSIFQNGIRSINVMGTMGCGKSRIAEALAKRAGLNFVDADKFHTPAAIAKMTEYKPLTDDDRRPFLKEAQAFLASGALRHNERVVSTSSALRRSYQHALRGLSLDKALGDNLDDAFFSPSDFPNIGLVFIRVEKPFEIALEEMDQAATHISKQRTLDGAAHFAITRKDIPESVERLRNQYNILVPPHPYEAIVLDTQKYKNSEKLGDYNGDAITQWLLQELSL